MRTSKLVLFLCVWLAPLSQAQTPAMPPAPKAPADVLIFTNGDKLTGKLTRAQGGNVVFHSDMAGDITVPFSKVKELRSGTEFVALRAGKPGKYKAAGTGTVAFAEDKLTLTPNAVSPTSTPQTIAPKDLGFLIDVPSYAREVGHQASWRAGWTGAATAGFTLVRSTQSSTTFNGALNFVRQIPTVAYLPKDHRTTIDVTETYGTSTTPIIPPTVPPSAPTIVQTSIFHADAERDQYFNTRLFALVDLSYDHNFANGLQLQQTYGAGIGWTPLQDARQQLDLKADVHYEKQQFIQQINTANGNTDIIGSTFQENYRRNLPMKVVFTEWANFLPAWNNLQAYSANAYVQFALPLYKRFSVSLSATDNYLNNPALYYKTNTVQYVTGVTYAFK